MRAAPIIWVMAARPVPRGAVADRVLACAVALVLVLVLAATATPASAAPGTSASVELEQTRERLATVSARLVTARDEREIGGAEEGAELARLERRLRLQKDRLLERERILAGLVGRESGDLARAADTEVARVAERVEPSAPAAQATPTPSSATAAPSGSLVERIDAYLASKASPLTGLGAVFVREGARVGVDPRLIVAIAGSETSFGTYGPAIEIHNPFGLGPHIPYPSWDAAIAAAATTLSGQFYLGEGRVTIAAIQQRWAPHGATNDPTGLNSNWTRNVGLYFAEQGGDPAAPVFSADAMAGRRPAAGSATSPSPGGDGGTAAGSALAAPAVGSSNAGPDAARAAAELLGRPTAAARGAGLGPARLIRRVYRRAGLALDGDLTSLARLGRAVRPSELRGGDVLVFAGPDGAATTLGVYLGDGAFVYAPPDGPVVALASLYQPRFTAAYAGARRY